MTKTYRLTFEIAEIMHALFDKLSAPQGWRISSRILREYIEYFGPKTEQLDMLAQDGKAIFTSFTEKIQDGKGTTHTVSRIKFLCLTYFAEVLKQPLETAIAIHTNDFDDFHVQEKVHIVISVKDFRAIVTHAETLRASISAYFSNPARPLQFAYQSRGLNCEFTLMTAGNAAAAPSAQSVKFVSTRSTSKQPSTIPGPRVTDATNSSQSATRSIISKPLSSQSGRPPLRDQVFTQSLDNPDTEESLFIPDRNSADEDQTWDPKNYDEDEGEMLGWDTNHGRPSETFRLTREGGAAVVQSLNEPYEEDRPTQGGIEPTQRLSQVCLPLKHLDQGRSTDRGRGSFVECSINVRWPVCLMSVAQCNRSCSRDDETRSTASEQCNHFFRYFELDSVIVGLIRMLYNLTTVAVLTPPPSDH
jgi:cell cycle checkpoint control protein RAD9A